MKDLYAYLATLSEDDLRMLNREVVNQLRERVNAKQQVAARAFRIGDTVEFTSNRGHGVIKITIDKINTKSVNGTEVGGWKKWRVSPTMLRAA